MNMKTQYCGHMYWFSVVWEYWFTKAIFVWCHDKEGNLITNSWSVIVRSFKNQKKSTDFGFEKAESLQLVSEHLVWILRIINNCVNVMNFRMVHTRQGTRTEPPSLERKGGGRDAQSWQDEDPLDDSKIIWSLVRNNRGNGWGWDA